MKNFRIQSLLFWVLAFVIMVAAAVYQRMTGPTHPVSGKVTIQGTEIAYTLTRSSEGEYEQEVPITVADPGVTGRLLYKRYKTSDTLTAIPFVRSGEKLVVMLPHQPAAGKLEYHVELDVKGTPARLPESGSIVTRSRDSVPAWILIPHVAIMFIGMMFGVRAGLEIFRKDPRPYTHVLWTTILLAIGGLIFGPIVQKYSFGAYWTGWPFGGDLTDNKTIVMVIVWLVAWFANRRFKDASPTGYAKWVILASLVITLATYLIPHSMFGSELKYEELDQPRPVATVIR